MKVLFLHGIGDEDRGMGWRNALDGCLRRNSLPTLDERGWNPLPARYLGLLNQPPDADPGPLEDTYIHDGQERPDEAAARFWARQASLERSLAGSGLSTPGPLAALPADTMANLALLKSANLEQAQKYRRNKAMRHAVLRAALRGVSDDDYVIIGHSLGSVVAADLLYHLPRRANIKLLITIGSPLSLEPLRGHLKRLNDNCPYDRLGAWLNVVGRNDVVTGSRGIARHFPEALDVFADTGGLQTAHSSIGYLDSDVVARALDWAEREGAMPVGAMPDVSLDEGLVRVIAGAQFALRVEQALRPGEQRVRFAGARALVLDALKAELLTAGQMHPVLNRLSRDNGELLRDRLSPPQAAETLLQAWLLNPIQPYETDVTEDTRLTALTNFATDLGLPGNWARQVVEAAKEARDAQKQGFAWWRAGLAAVGVAVIAAAPVLVLAAAPAALGGGAALVSGLAALGPGGMLGGLSVVGLVGGLGGSTLVAASALGRGSSEAVLSNIVFVHALAVARAELQIAVPGHPEWFILAQLEVVLHAERARLARFSDKNAPALKELDVKLGAVRRALDGLRDSQLSPGELEQRAQLALPAPVS